MTSVLARPTAAAAKRATRPAWRSREKWWAALFLGPQLIGLLAFVVFPLGFAVVLAFMQWDGLTAASFVGFDNFRAQLSDPEFGRAVWNTVKLGLITVPVGLFAALLVAIALNSVRGRTVYRVIYFLPVVTSSVAVAVMWKSILASGEYGILNNTVYDWFGITLPDWLDSEQWVIVSVAVVTIWSSMGLNVVILLAGLQTIPPQLVEAARIDGAGSVRIFRSITVPMMSPTLFFTTVVSVISSLQAFESVYILANPSHNDGARTIVYQVYDLGFQQFQFGLSSAAALILLVLTVGVTMIQFGAQKRLVHYEV